MRAAILVIFANAVGLIVFLQGRSDRLLSAVLDPLHPDWTGMERAYAGFTLYAVSLLAVALMGILMVGRLLTRTLRAEREDTPSRPWRRAAPTAAFAGALTAIVVLVFIEVLLFQDYGIHLYEFDVFSILADAALRRDLGIQPAEVLRVTIAAVTLLGAELLLCVAALRLARWRSGALARACGVAMCATIPSGLLVFRAGEDRIASDRAEFEGALPLGKQLLLRNTTRPFIAVRPKLGAGGYPVLGATDAAPALDKKSNILFFVADGFRADMIKPELTPSLLSFASRPGVIHSQRHFSTGHVSEAGIFGLLYGLYGHAYHPFIEARVPAYPIAVLKRNGYHTFLLESSRLNPYPSDELVRNFDEVSYPKNDDEAIEMLRRYIAARRADKRPYFVLAFFYTPHYPFTSAKPQFRRYPLIGPSARTNYMNDILQADDYFRQTFDLVRDDYDDGHAVVLATSDHGEEIRDHGVFGHASATFWNEKIVVPFILGLPGASLTPASRSPAMTSHVDVWPTLFEYLGTTPRVSFSSYSDGKSLLSGEAANAAHREYVAGRFFPYADRPSVLVDGSIKYWFRVSGITQDKRVCNVITRITDLQDHALPIDLARVDPDTIPAFGGFQSTFWRFLEPAAAATESRCGAR